MEPDSRRTVGLLGLFAASVIVSIGTYWAFERGADDFTVFFAAWKHVLGGEAMEIYRNSPDRFLYAPGFAWLFAPLAFLPKNAALAIWCFAKAALIGWMVREFAKSSEDRIASAGLTAWGIVLLARPVLIDFQYGQVNLLIVAACVWALTRHLRGPVSPAQDFWSWFFAAVAAIGKLFPIPILWVPFFATSFKEGPVSPQKLRWERAGLISGTIVILALPLLNIHSGEWLSLYGQWKQALLDRGFPLESHNQSFAAFLQHYFSGQPTQIIAQHRRELSLGFSLLSEKSIALLAMAWSLFFAGLIMTWIVKKTMNVRVGDWASRNRWIAAIIAFLILPSHLVWKPYFVMGLPLAFIAVHLPRRRWPVLIAIFLLINFSGFDILGQEWGARFEAASILLWCHLALSLASLTRSEATISERSA